MAEAKLIRTIELEPGDIDAGDRLRPVSEAAVESLIASIRETGIVKDEVLVREVKHQGGKLKLIAGAHRLEACARMGRKVPAKVFHCTDDWARLMEVDDNLAGAELGALDTAVFLAERKRLYEKLHPEAKRGFAGGKARHGQLTDIVSVSSFGAATAEKFGLSERHVFRLLAAGSALDRDEIDMLRAAPKPVTLNDLGAIAKIGKADERRVVVEALGMGGWTVAQARAKYAEKQGKSAPVKSPVEASLQRLLDAWDRAPKEARRRFVSSRREALDELLGETLFDGGDADE